MDPPRPATAEPVPLEVFQKLPKTDRAIPIVLSGGTARPKGFKELFEKARKLKADDASIDSGLTRTRYAKLRREAWAAEDTGRWNDAIEKWYEPGFWKTHVHPNDGDRALSYGAEQRAVTDRYELEYRMLAADGGVVWVHDIVAVVLENDGPSTLRGFTIDVTARKQADVERIVAETEALEQRERAAHLSRVNMLGEMATGIAHEVNQPLTAVSTYTQACRRMIDADLIDEAGIVSTISEILRPQFLKLVEEILRKS